MIKPIIAWAVLNASDHILPWHIARTRADAIKSVERMANTPWNVCARKYGLCVMRVRVEAVVKEPRP